MTELQRSKLSSRRFWLVCWACAVLTAWGTISIFLNNSPAWMSGTMAIIAGIPVSYVTISSMKKPQEGVE
jgi:hypothetical protein